MDTTTELNTAHDEPPTIRKSHHDYTVGWVCALPKEQTAAFAMLDKQHLNLPTPSTDKNSYILGEIHGHNIVIACLPAGQIGNNPAVAVATRMISTFQSIRFGLMVGIGGGIPPRVRLGDVVVSIPFGQHPGVVQWDFGKMEKEFIRTGSLHPPPTLLLTATTILRTMAEAKGTQIPTYMEGIRKNHPRLAYKYTWNKSLEDPYANGGQGAEAKLFMWIWRAFVALVNFLFGRSLLVPPSRPEPQSDERALYTEAEIKHRKPSVHYGLIASGNQVIKNAKVRDSVSKSLGGNILCFEMEAAGLMADFPCIVIRGICDYADSKKAKDWQEYAAAVAAAYAKELLSHVQPLEVHEGKPAKEIMSQVLDYTKAIKHRLDQEEDRQVLDWLTKVDYGSRQSDILRKRQPDTGIWFLNSPEYQSWLSSQGKQILFCPGIPGAGKTVLTSIVIDHLIAWFTDDKTVGFGYIYCNFKETNQQKIEHFLSSLLKQLAQTHTPLPDAVRDIYNKHNSRGTAPLGEIIKTLHTVAATYSKVYIIVDALDECQEDDDCRTNLISALLELYNRGDGIKLFITSRPIPDIEREFLGSLSKTIRARDEDVRKYLLEKVYKSKNTKIRECGDIVVMKILEAVDGMFLLANLYFQSVSTKTTTKRIKAALEALNKNSGSDSNAYQLAYDGAMERIESHNKDSKELAKQVLTWIVYGMRPLSASELQCALAVEIGAPDFDEENIPDINRMISVCAGLVTMEEKSRQLRLVHYTAQEYFEFHPQTLSSNCHTDILEVCVTYLSYNTFEAGPCEPWSLVEKRLESHPLYEYAAQKWPYHAHKSSIRAAPLVMGLLKNQNKLWASNQLQHFDDMRQNAPDFLGMDVTGLCFAACFGLKDPVAAFLSIGADTEIKESGWGRTPLSWATAHGNETVAKLLLESGANIEAKDDYNYTPLLLAVQYRREALVRLLTKRGANLEVQIDQLRTPLMLAIGEGQISIANILLESGANIEAKDVFGRTSLIYAADEGHLEIVKALLHKGADIEAKDGNRRSPLFAAITDGHTAVVELLLNSGADLNGTEPPNSPFVHSSLSAAALRGEVAIVGLLIDKGTDIETKDCMERTPLSLAAFNGWEAVVALLIKKGADIEARDNQGRTPLFLAAYEGRKSGELVRPRAGVEYFDIETENMEGFAEMFKNTTVVELLLDRGADIEARDYWGWTPLLSASRSRLPAIVKLLIERGADIEAKDNQGRTPLLMAVLGSNSPWGLGPIVVKLLLYSGADPEVRDNEGKTSRDIALERGNEEIVELLDQACKLPSATKKALIYDPSFRTTESSIPINQTTDAHDQRV
ncbi:hypothetical protein TWF506_008747 [Arthrobotrys conoides]|uniref:Nucleoside phosphorylase domain-containing protein n=1 Tax=Arthrobotrys conoides TaxID=74498 RepID=A0AAN8NF34_9PEZI